MPQRQGGVGLRCEYVAARRLDQPASRFSRQGAGRAVSRRRTARSRANFTAAASCAPASDLTRRRRGGSTIDILHSNPSLWRAASVGGIGRREFRSWLVYFWVSPQACSPELEDQVAWDTSGDRSSAIATASSSAGSTEVLTKVTTRSLASGERSSTSI